MRHLSGTIPGQQQLTSIQQGILNAKATTLDEVVELIIKGRGGADSDSPGRRSFG